MIDNDTDNRQRMTIEQGQGHSPNQYLTIMGHIIRTWHLPYRGLPAEIIIEIMDNLINDYRALYYAGLSNKLMYDFSVRLLYRKMYSALGTQSIDHKVNTPIKRTGNKAMRSLLNNLHLGKYVHEYIIEDPRPQLGESALPIQGLRRGLYAMVNLKHLTIETFDAERWKLLFDHFDYPRDGILTLNSTTFDSWSTSVPFHLETFACKAYASDAYSITHCTALQADLNTFLKTQSRVKRIEVQLHRGGWGRGIFQQQMEGHDRTFLDVSPTPSTYCPQLEWVIGDRAAIEALLPGRKVRILQWKYRWNDVKKSIRHLAKELAYLEVLALPASDDVRGADPPVAQMAQYMQNLKYLEVSNADLSSLDWTFNKLPSLIGIVLLSSEKRDRHPPMDIPARREKVVRLFDHIPTLRFCAVELFTKFLLRKNLERWQRITDAESPFAGNIPNYPDYVTRAFIHSVIYPSFN